MRINKRGKLTQRQQLRRKMHRIMLRYQPTSEQELLQALKKEKIRTYQRGARYGVFIGKIKLRLKTIQRDYTQYINKREQLKALGREHDTRTIEVSRPVHTAKQVSYNEKLESLKAISEEHERERENTNDHDHERE